MNIKNLLLILTLIIGANAVSACGMKRALTLPKTDPETPSFSEDLNSHDSIDVLKKKS